MPLELRITAPDLRVIQPQPTSIWPRLETLGLTTWVGVATGIYRPGLPLNILQCAGRPPHRRITHHNINKVEIPCLRHM